MIDLRDSAVRQSLMQSLNKISSARQKLAKKKTDKRTISENILKSTPKTLRVSKSITNTGLVGQAEPGTCDNMVVLIESGDLR